METERRGSEDSASSTTIATITNFSGLQASYNREDWIRLRDTWNAIRTSRLSLLQHSTNLETAIAEQSRFRDYASEIQNKEIRLKLHKERIQLARLRIRAVQFRLESALEEQVKREKERVEMEESVELMEKDIPQTSQQIHTMRFNLATLHNELVFRRRYMINELLKIFFPSIAEIQQRNGEVLPGTTRKSKCNCDTYDSIRENHLRTSRFRTDHSDVELSASAAYLIHLVDCFLGILNLPAKHLLNFNGSMSYLLDRDSLDVYNLFPGTKQKRKKSRGYFSNTYYLDESLPKLAEVVMILRTECGLVTTDRDRPVKNFMQVMLSCLGRKLSSRDTEELFVNQANPFSSASSTIFRCSSKSSDGPDFPKEAHAKNGSSMSRMQKKFAKGLTINCEESNSLLSILEVVSPTWSVMKLAAEETSTMRKTSTSKKEVTNYSLAMHS